MTLDAILVLETSGPSIVHRNCLSVAELDGWDNLSFEENQDAWFRLMGDSSIGFHN